MQKVLQKTTDYFCGSLNKIRQRIQRWRHRGFFKHGDNVIIMRSVKILYGTSKVVDTQRYVFERKNEYTRGRYCSKNQTEITYTRYTLHLILILQSHNM